VGHADLEAGKVRADTEVCTVPEREVWVGITPQHEAIWIVEMPRVPVGRSLPHGIVLNDRASVGAVAPVSEE
jgi:hypothetical protein